MSFPCFLRLIQDPHKAYQTYIRQLVFDASLCALAIREHVKYSKLLWGMNIEHVMNNEHVMNMSWTMNMSWICHEHFVNMSWTCLEHVMLFHEHFMNLSCREHILYFYICKFFVIPVEEVCPIYQKYFSFIWTLYR